MSSRDKAIVAAVRKFDGFGTREDWDVLGSLRATLEAAGCEPLFQLVLDAAHDAGHIVWADDPEIHAFCVTAEQYETALAGAADVEAIVRGLAQIDPYIHGGNAPWTCITCTWAEVDTETAAHEPWCAWRQARDWVDRHPVTDTGGRE